MATSADEDQKTARCNWPALEANPEVLTNFIHGVGVPKTWAFHDVLGLDAELLGMVPQPAQAFVLLYPDAEHPDQTRDASSEASSPFFLWQGPPLGNACGTIASIHAVVNTAAGESLVSGSALASFVDETKGLHPQDRGLALEKHEGIRAVHCAQAQEGQTQSHTEAVDHHFVCFVHSGGRLLELDGLKGAPVDRGPTNQDSLLVDAAEVVKAEFFAKNPDAKYILLALGPSMD
eukprot:CAMPEP_0179450592 /NCGR_PEP_ID=MMETSP0799-20121207/34587_1 /TAXON_ID=46947 /ORGANISM="Geminigera cryophila, Strain CCMP2564" /LENGTH=233 /DNA_ID=CAMNT_0021244887 /DNA_START=182 /DNA_END=883 /DNA_ORIENTATION=+